MQQSFDFRLVNLQLEKRKIAAAFTTPPSDAMTVKKPTDESAEFVPIYNNIYAHKRINNVKRIGETSAVRGEKVKVLFLKVSVIGIVAMQFVQFNVG